MILIGIVLILLGLFVAGWGIALWIGIGFVIVGLILNLQTDSTGRRGRYW